ncbi:LPXTG cell wall anchor domain-containing protein, partial [Streptococcus mitis]|uniref:LPXTG cell wall anchor domain-containing protein n=1 Tax=Streptococcus mitis TaxID=28037 RepID=UPI001FED4674
NKVHHYKRVVTPQHFDTEVPETPSQHSQSAQPSTPSQPAVPTPKYVDGQKELPNTGTEANASLAALGLLGVLGGFGLLARKKKEN